MLLLIPSSKIIEANLIPFLHLINKNILFFLLNPFNIDGEPIKLPDNLESLPRADHFPIQRHRWNTNEVQL